MPAEPIDDPTDRDRRHDEGLRFDAERGRLRLGRHAVELADDADNRAVLVAYVELTARSRHDRIANVVEVRQADVEALALALDVEAEDLAAQVERILGASRADAQRVVARLRESRLVSGIGRAAAAAAVAGALATACASGPTGPQEPGGRASVTEQVRPTTTTTTDPVDVSLIPPISIDRDPPES
jgi:hypothetical protein